MKTIYHNLKRDLQENQEDLLYLLFAGTPFGLFCIFLNSFFTFGGLY